MGEILDEEANEDDNRLTDRLAVVVFDHKHDKDFADVDDGVQ